MFENVRIAVCVHLYYVEMFEEICNKLKNFGEISYDLFFTMPRENKAFLPVLKKVYPKAKIIPTDNIGFDIYPFLCFLNEIELSDYDVIFKIHSKKDIPIDYSLNGVNLSGDLWRKYLLNSIVGSPARIQFILRIIERQKHVGMMGSEALYIQGGEKVAQDIALDRIFSVMQELKVPVRNIEFIAGAMFAIRPNLLIPLKKRKFNKEEFPPYFPRDWNSLPYCLERVFGCLVSAQGSCIVGIEDEL